jgi:hypothetical protein
MRFQLPPIKLPGVRMLQRRLDDAVHARGAEMFIDLLFSSLLSMTLREAAATTRQTLYKSPRYGPTPRCACARPHRPLENLISLQYSKKPPAAVYTPYEFFLSSNYKTQRF